MKTKLIILALVLTAAFAAKATAATIPYPNIGTEAPAHQFTATTTGEIWGYFFGGDAAWNSVVGMSINGAAPGVFGLQNHTVAHGDSLMLGVVNLGDDLDFELRVTPDSGPDISWFSHAAFNTDGGTNHAYATAWGGESTIPPGGVAKVPAGTYIGFEDWPLNHPTDFDYNDHQFVFKGLVENPVPEPATMLLFGTGLLGLGLAATRRRKGPKA
jgi:hypothetical protein